MQNQDPKSFKQLTISVEKLPASMARQEQQKSYAAERARLLLGCYRTGEANDPETYVAAVTAVLSRYSEAVVTEVTHPATGLPKQKSWLPTVKEVYDACEAAHAPIAQRLREEKETAEQLRERRAEELAREHRPTVAELKAKYGENWGMTSLDLPKKPSVPAPTIEQLRHHYKHYDLEYRPKELEEHIDAGFGPSTA